MTRRLFFTILLIVLVIVGVTAYLFFLAILVTYMIQSRNNSKRYSILQNNFIGEKEDEYNSNEKK